MDDTEKRPHLCSVKYGEHYLAENLQLIISAALMILGICVLGWYDAPALAGSLFGAAGALLGAWITELNRRRTDAKAKAEREEAAIAALAPELLHTIEKVQTIMERAVVNHGYEPSSDHPDPGDREASFRPRSPTLYPSAPQVRDLPRDKAIALIRYYSSLDEISTLVDEWWGLKETQHQNIFNSLIHAAEKSLRLALVCAREFHLDGRFPLPNAAWGEPTFRIKRAIDKSPYANSGN